MATCNEQSEHLPLTVVFLGHVDHGKSSVLGRILADSEELSPERLHKLRLYCQRHGKIFEYAYLTDALKEERAKGITIDCARIPFKTAKRNYQLIDAPGHVEFLKNMVTGTSQADAAFLLIDASTGIKENTRRHGKLVSLLGLRQLVVLVNKMDLVGYQEQTFRKIEKEYGDFLQACGLKAQHFIPISAREGDSVASHSNHMSWYGGPTVLEALDSFTPSINLGKAVRFPLQDVYHFDTGTHYVGTLESGHLKAGDSITFYPSQQQTRIERIDSFPHPKKEAFAGEAVAFKLSPSIPVSRGEVATLTHQASPEVSDRVEGTLFWLSNDPLLVGKNYQMKLGTTSVGVHVGGITEIRDASSLAEKKTDSVLQHDVAKVRFSLSQPIAFDTDPTFSATQRFVLVDGYRVAGGGLLTQKREPSQKTPPIFWLTGLSGAGKTTLGVALSKRLKTLGHSVVHIDGDSLRKEFKENNFSRPARLRNMRRAMRLATQARAQGKIAIVSLISPYRQLRERFRLFHSEFYEIYLSTSLEICEARDAKGLYEKARRGEIPSFTGINDPYEIPAFPDLEIDASLTPEQAAERVLETCLKKPARL